MTNDWHYIMFRANTRKKHLERFENICKENGWVVKGEQVIRPNTKPYVIMIRAEIVGYFALDTVKDNQVCFWGFYISPKYRGQGIGTTALLKILFGLSKLTPVPNSVFCYFKGDNEIAKHIYLKYGYLYGKDERLYDNFVSCSNPYCDKDGHIAVFFQRVWGNEDLTIKKELQDVFDLHTIRK